MMLIPPMLLTRTERPTANITAMNRVANVTHRLDYAMTIKGTVCKKPESAKSNTTVNDVDDAATNDVVDDGDTGISVFC